MSLVQPLAQGLAESLAALQQRTLRSPIRGVVVERLLEYIRQRLELGLGLIYAL